MRGRYSRMQEEFVRVDEWIPSLEDIQIKCDGKIVIIPFDVIFKRTDIGTLNNFFIKKESYSKKLPEITHYINYFIKHYDPEHELLLGYFKLKYIIDNKIIEVEKGGFKKRAFIKALHSFIFTKNIINKISKMTEDNYYVDVSKKKDDNRKYAESLEFTNEHAVLMMKISVAMKIMIPVMFHYINTYQVEKTGPMDLFSFYERLFDIFNEDINIYNKLWYSIFVEVNMSYSKNKTIWHQREFKGTCELEQANYLLKDKIISETFFKYSFNKNIINFNNVVLRKQLEYFRIDKYP
jgi:hypothetical protein